jgi:hypothetical protein
MTLGRAPFPADRYRPIPNERPPVSLLDRDDTQIGRSLPVQRGANAVSLITAEGESKWGQVVTIHCQVSRVAFPAGVPDRRAPVEGLLQWGQGAARFSAQIDLRSGVCATLVATSVQLSAQLVGSTGEVAESADVAAAVIWGTRPGRSRSTRTLPRTTIGIGGSQTWEVPPFGYALTLYTPIAAFYAAASTSTITLHGGPLVTDDPELVISAGALGVAPLTFEGLLLSGNSRFVTVANLTGALLPIRPTFSLEL